MRDLSLVNNSLPQNTDLQKLSESGLSPVSILYCPHIIPEVLISFNRLKKN